MYVSVEASVALNLNDDSMLGSFSSTLKLQFCSVWIQ